MQISKKIYLDFLTALAEVFFKEAVLQEEVLLVVFLEERFMLLLEESC